MSSAPLNSDTIKAEALRLGFSACGVVPAEPVGEDYVRRFDQWIAQGHHADMQYMAGNVEKRHDPRLLVEGVRTIVSVAMNYYPARRAAGISLYAQGRDYHDVMRQRLQELMEAIGAEGRCFVDTAPVHERYWAWRAGLGWIGRNRQLILPGLGSSVFLGELFILQEADRYDEPREGDCGGCNRCIAACPSGALSAEGLDARRCLSYLTIEHRGTFPTGTRLGDTFYGCDCCQMVCPHMRQARPTEELAFQPSEALLAMTTQDWQSLSVERYQQLFRGSAVKRAKYDGLVRNIQQWTIDSIEPIEAILRYRKEDEHNGSVAE